MTAEEIAANIIHACRGETKRIHEAEALIALHLATARTEGIAEGAREMRERAANIVYANQQTTSNTPTFTRHHLTRRKPFNIDGLAYADAIVALPLPGDPDA